MKPPITIRAHTNKPKIQKPDDPGRRRQPLWSLKNVNKSQGRKIVPPPRQIREHVYLYHRSATTSTKHHKTRSCSIAVRGDEKS